MQVRFCLIALFIFFHITPLHAGNKPVGSALDDFVRARLVDTILMFDRHFRIAESGQYLDAVNIGEAKQSRLLSSIAATGIGLVSLAVGDALGVIDDAEGKAVKTLSNLLNSDAESGFKITRSRSGWYPHFIDAKTGNTSEKSNIKFSTIDTALLVLGSAMASRYFNAKSYSSGKGESRVYQLSTKLIDSIDWSSSIRDVDQGLVHHLLIGMGEKEMPGIVFARPFDEYALLPCVAMRTEQMAGWQGPGHKFFLKHYADVSTLPMNDFEGESITSKEDGSFIAHFTHLFVYYYCNSVSNQKAYHKELRELVTADRRHFAVRGQGRFSPSLWGLGAGSEIKFNQNGSFGWSGYGVNDLKNNPHNTASPAIMAGFAPLFSPGEDGDPIVDLYTLWKSKTCRYEHQGLGFLWRCSARNPALKVNRVEAIDFSTYLLGLAARDRAIGFAFFRLFNL